MKKLNPGAVCTECGKFDDLNARCGAGVWEVPAKDFRSDGREYLVHFKDDHRDFFRSLGVFNRKAETCDLYTLGTP